jgi:hypothetical protein
VESGRSAAPGRSSARSPLILEVVVVCSTTYLASSFNFARCAAPPFAPQPPPPGQTLLVLAARALPFTRFVRYSLASGGGFLLAVCSAPLNFSPCPPRALQVPPKGSGVCRAQIEEEDKLIAFLVMRFACPPRPLRLPPRPSACPRAAPRRSGACGPRRDAEVSHIMWMVSHMMWMVLHLRKIKCARQVRAATL